MPASWSVLELERDILGSGFCILDDATVCTARHVLPEEERHVGGQVNVGLPIPDMGGTPDPQSRSLFLPWEASCVAESAEDDLAILHLHGKLPMRAIRNGVEEDARLQPFAIDDQPVPDGEAIAVSGYPLAHPAMVTTTGVIASAWAINPAAPSEVGARHLADVTAAPGSSGAPCYRASDGRLVGVLVGGRTLPGHGGYSGLSVLVPAGRVRNLIAASGL